MGRKRRKKSAGGYLIGPSHEQGGILATTPGMPDVELEGGEYIINAQTVNALGTQFLDQLNSTQTTYHTGGFGAGELPSPSNYRRGGVIRKKRRGGRTRKMQTGGRNGCGPGMVYQNGGCVPVMRKGGKPRKKMPHGGPHAQANEFRNRRTGQTVPVGAAYHIHPDKGPMEGAVHNPDIPGGTAGHDFYDRISNSNGRNNMRNMRRGGRPAARRMRRGGRPAARRMRRGGNIRRMPHGGPHNGNGRGGSLFCPNGNYGYDEYGKAICV